MARTPDNTLVHEESCKLINNNHSVLSVKGNTFSTDKVYCGCIRKSSDEIKVSGFVNQSVYLEGWDEAILSRNSGCPYGSLAIIRAA